MGGSSSDTAIGLDAINFATNGGGGSSGRSMGVGPASSAKDGGSGFALKKPKTRGKKKCMLRCLIM
jgi:hypothetical protein